jgi:lipoprotein-anchoring transpeptidase ErfK/SrfK
MLHLHSRCSSSLGSSLFIALAAAALFAAPSPALAQSSAYTDPAPQYYVPFPFGLFAPQRPVAVERALPEARAVPDMDDAAEVPAHLRRQVVAYATQEAPGTIVIDTPNTYLYYVLGNGRAMRYGIGVGRDGFTWSGTQRIARKTEWPDWHPPAEMIARQPYLPRFVAGGPTNPLGARALYLGNSMYRIHGTNMPQTIGGRVSSGCIRMLNEDVVDLYERVNVGTKVVVLPDARTRRPAVASLIDDDSQAAAPTSFYREIRERDTSARARVVR